MIRYLIVFIVLVAITASITGCAGPKAEQKAEPNQPQGKRAVVTPEPEIEPLEIEPVPEPEIEPLQIEPVVSVSFHDKCADIFKTYVNDNGMVDYKELRRKRLEIKELLDEFNNLDENEYKTWPEKDKIAFWINAYNIQIIDIILQNYPIESSRWARLWFPPNSIRHLSGDFQSVWNNYKFLVMDEEFTLAGIEKRFFYEEFNEPRVFFALSRASVSGPGLRNEPYYGGKLDEQLDDQAKKFLSKSLAFKIDRTKHVVYLSALLQPSWVGSQFTDKYGTNKKFKDHPATVRAVLNFIKNYIPDKDVSYLETGNYTVKYIAYDWRLNE